MAPSVWVAADTLDYPAGAGHLWSYLNWALGLAGAGCEVVWMERWRGTGDRAALEQLVERLAAVGLRRLCLFNEQGEDASVAAPMCLWPVEQAAEADLLLNIAYELPASLLRRFARRALLDIDPGMTQTWAAAGAVAIAEHDVYLTTGEGIATGTAPVPGGEVDWLYVPPCVALDVWPASRSPPGAAYSTVTHWWGDGSFVLPGGRVIDNSKRASFLPYVGVPERAGVKLELAAAPEDLEDDAELLRGSGWSLADPVEKAGTPQLYRRYIAGSRGEFSCAKPAYVELLTGWISDRTVCYLASGRPAVVQDTGPCRLLDEADGQGIFRFGDLEGAVSALRAAEREHPKHCELARKLAEEHFDARRAATALMELCLP